MDPMYFDGAVVLSRGRALLQSHSQPRREDYGLSLGEGCSSATPEAEPQGGRSRSDFYIQSRCLFRAKRLSRREFLPPTPPYPRGGR